MNVKRTLSPTARLILSACLHSDTPLSVGALCSATDSSAWTILALTRKLAHSGQIAKVKVDGLACYTIVPETAPEAVQA